MVSAIRITEKDAEWVASFSEWIVSVFGAVRKGGEEIIFEVPEGFDVDAYHGIERYSGMSFKDEFADVVAWLENYRGTFPFYLSLKDQLAKNGRLSDRQIDSVVRAMIRDREFAEKKAAPDREYSIKPGTVIVIGKWLAKEIAQKAGAPRAFHTLKVMACLGETEKAYKLKVKLSAQRTSFCGMCGLALTNPESVASGIGPICGQKWGLPETNLLALAESFGLMELREVETWIPKATIKERRDP